MTLATCQYGECGTVELFKLKGKKRGEKNADG
jgi:hypothetical protein